MGRRAVALDMDGTTLSSRHGLAPRTAEAIRRADAAGLRVVIATGRPAVALQPFVDQLALPGPVPAVCFNGACTLFLQAEASRPPAPVGQGPEAEGQTGRVVFAETLTLEAAEQVLGLCRELDWCASYCRALASAAAPRGAEHERLLRSFERLEGVRQERLPGFDAFLAAGELPLKVVAMADDPDANAAQARAALPEGLVNIIAAEQHVEFVSPDVNKGKALARLCSEELGVALQDVIAFGDNNNDREMLRLVGEGVAMGNAKDAVKAVADRTCAWTNDQEGVARELEQLLAASEPA